MGESEKKSSSKTNMVLRIIVVCIIGYFVLVAVAPNFVRPQVTGGGGSCVMNLRQIDAAAQQFALENHLTNGAPIHYPSDLTPYLRINDKGQVAGCPKGGTYSISKVGEPPICSLGTTVTPAHVLP